jgi:hypothetical protein
MAILEKRKSVNQLPRFERYQDTRGGDRAAALRGETPITSAVRQLAGTSGYGPMADQGFNPMSGAGIRGGMGNRGGAGQVAGNQAPITSALAGQTTRPSVTTKPAVANALAQKPAGNIAPKTTAASTTSKVPGLTSKTSPAATTAKSITSAGTGAAKNITSAGSGNSTLTNSAATKNAGSKIGKTITDALTGAAVGVAGKTLLDKLTGTKTSNAGTTSKAGTSGTTSGTGLKVQNNPLGTNLGTSVIKNKDVNQTGKTQVDQVLPKKVTTSTGTTANVNSVNNVQDPAQRKAATSPTSVVKNTATTPTTTTRTTAGPKSPVSGASRSTAGKVTPAAGAATGATRSLGGAKTAEDIKAENPELTEEEVQAELDRLATEGNDYSAVPEGSVDNGDGTYSETVDGITTTYDADGKVIGMEAAEDTTIGGDGNDTIDVVQNSDGTTTVTYSDGRTETTDINGDIVDSTAANDGQFTDADGNIYDADGILVQYANGELPIDDGTEDVAYTDEYGNTFDSNGVLISEADHSGFTQQDAEGNTYDWDGQLISYADGTTPDDYNTEDTSTDDTQVASEDTSTDDSGDEYVAKKGGLMHMADGGTPPPDDGEDNPISEEDNGDGTITQYFDDGSEITYNANGDVLQVKDAPPDTKAPPAIATRGITVGTNGQQYSNPQTAADYKAAGIGRNTDENSLQSFLDNIPTTNAIANPDIQTTALDTTPTGGLTQAVQRPALNIAPGDYPAADQTEEIGTGNYMPEGAVDNGDGTYTLGNEVFSMVNGNPLYTMNNNGDIIYTEPSTQNGYKDNGDGTYTINGTTYDMQSDMPLYRDKPGGGVDVATDNGDGTYTIGNTTYDMQTNQPVYEERGGTTYDMTGKPLWTTDSAGNIISPDITSSGGKGGTRTENPLTGSQKKASAADEANQNAATEDFLKSLTGSLGGYGGSALAGAVLGGLLGNADLFGGNTTQSNPVDMSKVGVINPRTTDFGIGPANYVGYDQYGTPEAMPELYGNELYQNLNAPGFNEVNPGDYARMDAQMAGDNYDPYSDETGEVAPDDENAEGMAEGGMPQGGLSNMQTYYTFGTPVDPMQNLYNPQPAPQQPQQPPQGMPPQAAQNQQQMAMSQPVQALPPGMPQGAPQGQNMGMAKPPMPQQNPMQTGPQGLKSGGLPAWSNVPITAGRLNFRDGAPVHGAGDGQSDNIPAMLADGEYVFDAETVAQIGNGSTKAGAQALDKFRENIRAHKRSAPINKIPPKTKALTSYLKGAR